MAHGGIHLKNGRTSRSYPEHRAPYQGRMKPFPWKRTEEGRKALVVIWLSALQMASDSQLAQCRSFSEYGITQHFLYNRLEEHCPEVLDRYERLLGRPMKRDLPIRRLYMMYLQHKGKGAGCKAGYSREHPMEWAGELVYEVQQEMRRTKKVLGMRKQSR